MTLAFPIHLIPAALDTAFAEDLGLAGDITSNLTIPDDARARAAIVARKPGRIAGLPLAEAAFKRLDPDVSFETVIADGGDVEAGSEIARVKGKARTILSAERVALNYLGHLSGIATATRAYAQAIEGTSAKICCTRKTTPGLRAFEKYAVLAGGGMNHRFGLFDAVLIKDNHIAASGGIGAAIKRARLAGHLVKIEVEVDRLEQLEEALHYPVDAVLLDNMSLEDLRKAVKMCRERNIILEASGGVTLDTVHAIAETGVNVISSGALTHSASVLDIGLDFTG